MSTLNIVVTCTKQKTREPTRRLQLRNISSDSIEERAACWSKRLCSTAGESIPARQLYAGDHWAVARDLAKAATRSRKINVWVISAGYGVINIDEPILPYSATFSNPHPDSVIVEHFDATKREQKADWWNSLIVCDWPRESPRSVRALAAEMPDCPLIIAASKNYLTAVYDDLLEARNELNDSNLLSIISAGTEQLEELSGNLVPADARLQHYVGGVRRSLNIRLVRHAMDEMKRGNFTLNRLCGLFAEMLDAAPALVKYDRAPLSDAAIRQYVRFNVGKRPHISHTPLLRELRASGRACEQKRFRQLFQEVKEAMHG